MSSPTISYKGGKALPIMLAAKPLKAGNLTPGTIVRIVLKGDHAEVIKVQDV